jgi:hypothetical protein
MEVHLIIARMQSEEFHESIGVFMNALTELFDIFHVNARLLKRQMPQVAMHSYDKLSALWCSKGES